MDFLKFMIFALSLMGCKVMLCGKSFPTDNTRGKDITTHIFLILDSLDVTVILILMIHVVST